MRLSLVRTLAMRPSVVLADEPFGALDQITRHHLHDELLDLHSKSPFAMVIVTHAIDEAVYLADRVITMSPAPGRFVATTEIKLDRPRTSALRYTAAFGELCGRVASTLNEASSPQRGSTMQVDSTPKRTSSRGTT
jgi:NitT/TauT family transport system ATP-binding protein